MVNANRIRVIYYSSLPQCQQQPASCSTQLLATLSAIDAGDLTEYVFPSNPGKTGAHKARTHTLGSGRAALW